MGSSVSLALCASPGPCSSALRIDGDIRTLASTDATGLAPAVRTLFADAGRSPHDLTELRVDVGPGSYTGLRAALTFARTLQTFTGVPTSIATSLELIALVAWTELGLAHATALRPVLDARRGRLHHARLTFTEHIELATEPRADTLQAFATSLQPGETLLADVALHEQLAPLAERSGCNLHAPIATGSPFGGTAGARSGSAASCTYDGRHLFHPALSLRETEPAGLEPLYLMGSYAQ